MFTATWKKYLPVIIILLKRSSQGEQTLEMNITDFERASGGRKVKFGFNNLHMENARMNINEKHTPLAREFGAVLQESPQARAILLNQYFEFSMSTSSRLLIRNVTPEQIPETATDEITEKSAEPVLN